MLLMYSFESKMKISIMCGVQFRETLLFGLTIEFVLLETVINESFPR